MSEPHATEPQELPVESQLPSPGNMLKEARVQQGMSVEQIASKLFLNVSQIASIEADELESASSITFVKGYVKNYSRLLGLDTSVVITAFEQIHKAKEPEAKLQSFSRRVAKQNHDDRWMLVTYGILLLLVAGVVVWWYQQPSDVTPTTVESQATSDNEPLSQPTEESTEPTVAAISTDAPILIQPPPTEQQSATESLPADTDVALTTNTERPELAIQDNSEQAIDSEAPTVAEIADEGELLAEGADEGAQFVDLESNLPEPILMVFTFGEDCWVNITDATGEDIAYGVKQSGRVMSISGVPPVEVTLGAPDNVAITVNGDAVDMSGYNNGRTARFTLPIQVN